MPVECSPVCTGDEVGRDRELISTKGAISLDNTPEVGSLAFGFWVFFFRK